MKSDRKPWKCSELSSSEGIAPLWAGASKVQNMSEILWDQTRPSLTIAGPQSRLGEKPLLITTSSHSERMCTPPPPPPGGIESREIRGSDAKETYEESGVHLDGAKTVMWWRPLGEVWEGEA